LIDTIRHVSRRASARLRCKGKERLSQCKKRGHMRNRVPIRTEIGPSMQKRGAYEQSGANPDGGARPRPAAMGEGVRSKRAATSHMPLYFAEIARFSFESAPGSSYAPVPCRAGQGAGFGMARARRVRNRIHSGLTPPKKTHHGKQRLASPTMRERTSERLSEAPTHRAARRRGAWP